MADPDQLPRQVADDHSSHPWPLNVFVKEWPVVVKAPRSFTLCVLAVSLILCFGAYWLINNFYDAELKAKNATIETLSLRPESIPAQEQEINLLKSELTSIQDQMPKKWTALTKDQIALWAKTLGSQHIQSMIVYWDGARNAEQLYSSLVDVGKISHFNVNMGVGFASDPEVEIVTAKGEPSAHILADLFKSINNRVKLEEGNAPIDIPPLGVIYIFIGEKI